MLDEMIRQRTELEELRGQLKQHGFEIDYVKILGSLLARQSEDHEKWIGDILKVLAGEVPEPRPRLRLVEPQESAEEEGAAQR